MKQIEFQATQIKLLAPSLACSPNFGFEPQSSLRASILASSPIKPSSPILTSEPNFDFRAQSDFSPNISRYLQGSSGAWPLDWLSLDISGASSSVRLLDCFFPMLGHWIGSPRCWVVGLALPEYLWGIFGVSLLLLHWVGSSGVGSLG
jgi:hypothetical protein